MCNIQLRQLLLIVLCFSFKALASSNQVSVPQTTAILSSELNSDIVQIRNIQNDIAFVKASVVEVFIDKVGTETYSKISGKHKSNGVIVLPEKFIISPKGASNVRLIFNGEPSSTSDRYFKIRFTPVVEYEYKGEKKNEVNNSVFVSITNSTFAVVPKINPNPVLFFETNASNGIRVTNTGDSIVLLNDCQICVDSLCTIQPNHRLIKGRTRIFAMSDNQQKLKKDGVFNCHAKGLPQKEVVHKIIPFNT